MKFASKNAAKGFTLIELIVVIVIIGILAAMAIPRFIALQKDARIAKMQGIYGSMRSAAMLARAECEVDLSGQRSTTATCTSTGGTANMDGTAITMVNKYPAAIVATTGATQGIIAAAQLDVTNDGLVKPNTTTAIDDTLAAGVLQISIKGATTPGTTCMIGYTPATATAAPVFSLDKSGC